MRHRFAIALAAAVVASATAAAQDPPPPSVTGVTELRPCAEGDTVQCLIDIRAASRVKILTRPPGAASSTWSCGEGAEARCLKREHDARCAAYGMTGVPWLPADVPATVIADAEGRLFRYADVLICLTPRGPIGGYRAPAPQPPAP